MTQEFKPKWLDTPQVRDIAAAFDKAGAALWFVGGCVRNSLIGSVATDIDAATDAVPDNIIQIAEDAGLKAIPTGIEHGTITVVSEGVPIEITTFRKDVATDGRRAVVSFSTDIAEDAQRRDFTMNALYLSSEGYLADPCGTGLDDLKARKVRFIGVPEARIREDYLRILRYFRFFAWYGDPAEGVDPEALSAIAELQEGLDQISSERIGAEIRKLLLAIDPVPAVAAMAQCGVLGRLLPGAGIGLLGPFVHLESEAGFAPEMIARLVALGGENPADRLRLSRAEQKSYKSLIAALERDEVSHEAAGYRLGAHVARQRELLRRASMGAPLDKVALEKIEVGAKQIFLLKAADLPDGFSGPEIGEALRQAEELWIESGFSLDRATLLEKLL